MLWDTFDMGNATVATKQNTLINNLMDKVIKSNWICIDPFSTGIKTFSGISYSWDTAGTETIVTYIRDNGTVNHAAGVILPKTIPDDGFVLQGKGTKVSEIPWAVWIEPPKEGDTVLIWDVSCGSTLILKNGTLENLPPSSIRVSFMDTKTSWKVDGVHYLPVNGKITVAQKWSFPKEEAPKKKSSKYDSHEADDFNYVPPEVAVESPFAALMAKRKK